MRHTLFPIFLLLVSCSSISVTPDDLRTDSVADHRRRAARLIAVERRTNYLPALLETLRSDDVSIVRAQAALSIGELGVRNENVYSQFMASLETDPSPLVQQDVIYALKKLNYKKASAALAGKLRSSPHEGVRADAAFALKKLGSGEELAALKEGVDDSSRRVQFASRSTLDTMPQYDPERQKEESKTREQDVAKKASQQKTRTEKDRWWMIR